MYLINNLHLINCTFGGVQHIDSWGNHNSSSELNDFNCA